MTDEKLKEYTITVDYTKTIKQAIKAGKYNWFNNNINSQNFPESEAKKSIASTQQKSQVSTQIVLIPLNRTNRTVATNEVLKELDQKGYRPANLYELLALGAQHPDLQRTNWIVGLGSSWTDSWDGHWVPCLDRYDAERHLYLGWSDSGWGGGWRFAVISNANPV